ncbi:MAG: glycosyltransferase family 39 protein [Parcubacteria group bacterium]|jgi:4-amino-4-deoxy-L-arabinose transferase-like glycosyltransferase
MQNKKTLTLVLLILIVAFGFFARTYHINQAPPGVYPDEAVNAQDAINANQTGQYLWFYPDNNGREGLQMNLEALSFKLFGISDFSLKLPSIIFGALTVLGMYLLSKELFRTASAGLIGAGLTAVSFWAIHFSRMAFRAIQLPFVLVFSFYFLFRAVRTKKISDFILGGAFLGLGLHGYIAFRITPLILIVVLLAFILSRENFLKIYWKYILIYTAAAIVVAAPMLYTFYVHPEYFSGRSNEVSIFNPEINQGHLFTTALKTLGMSLAKYNFWGDQNWRHNFPPYPVLDFLTGIAFLFGIIFSFVRFFHLLGLRLFKKIKNTQLEVYTLLLVWFFVMLIPEFMTDEGLPHALRSIGTMPVALLFAVMTFDYFYHHANKRTWLQQKLVKSLVIVMLLSIGIFNVVKYFYFWAPNPKAAQAFEKNLMEVSDYIKTVPPQTEKFVVAESMQRIPIKVFNTDLPNTYYVYPGEVSQIQPKDIGNFTVVLTDNNSEAIASLKSKFPSLTLQEIRDSVGMSYYILK